MSSQNPLSAIVQGRDWNFFQKVTVSNTGSFNTNCDIVIPFTTQGIQFLNLGTGVVEVSLNGNTVHFELNSANPSAGLTFDNRVISKVWFRVQTASTAPIIVSVMAWARQ